MTQYTKMIDVESLLNQAFDVCAENIENLRQDYVRIPEMEYFLNVLKTHFDPKVKRKPEIVVFGTDFSMELVKSITGCPPYWVPGGSRVLQYFSDEFVPRDTDPVTRAALGKLFANKEWKKSTLVVIPCSSDAQRKAAYLLQNQGWKVVTIWIPAVKDLVSHKSFLSELDHAVRTICRHVGKRYSVFSLNKSVKYFNNIRTSIQMFLNAAYDNESVMPGILRMAVMDSFFMCDNLDEWELNLKKLTAAIKLAPVARTNQPRVLLIGSPVFFPNYKIPNLLSISNIEICGNIDCRTGMFKEKFGAKEKGLETLAQYYFEHDSSSAFVHNEKLQEAIRDAVEQNKPDGIIWHVLKGQIEYDFELQRCEGYFEEKGLPVIRLETDYQYQDIEQLRIRIEAFAELLTQKQKEKGAVKS